MIKLCYYYSVVVSQNNSSLECAFPVTRTPQQHFTIRKYVYICLYRESCFKREGSNKRENRLHTVNVSQSLLWRLTIIKKKIYIYILLDCNYWSGCALWDTTAVRSETAAEIGMFSFHQTELLYWVNGSNHDDVSINYRLSIFMLLKCKVCKK